MRHQHSHSPCYLMKLTKVSIVIVVHETTKFEFGTDFMEYFLRKCHLDNDEDASPHPTYENDCSDTFAADMSALQDDCLWSSPNYKLVSEYANSMSFLIRTHQLSLCLWAKRQNQTNTSDSIVFLVCDFIISPVCACATVCLVIVVQT